MTDMPVGPGPEHEQQQVDINADLEALLEAGKRREFGEYWITHNFEHLIYPNADESAEIVLRRFIGEENTGPKPTIRIESSEERAVELATGQRYRGKRLRFWVDEWGPYNQQPLPEADPDTTDSFIDTRVGPIGQQQMHKLMAPKAVITGSTWTI